MKKHILTALVFIFIVSVFYSQDITVYKPGLNARNKKDPVVKAAEIYSEKTGGKVHFILEEWENWQDVVMRYISAGSPIDVVYAQNTDFPLFYAKNYLQPLDGYVNLTAPYISKKAMDTCFKYNKKYYAATNKSASHYWMVAYNKTYMDECGIPEQMQPYALWKSGKWKWAQVRNLALKLSVDSDYDGQNDKWGFVNPYTEGFIYSNNVTFTKINKKAKVKLNLKKKKLLKALNYVGTAIKEGWYHAATEENVNWLESHRGAMLMTRDFEAFELSEKSKDEIRFVPVPYGPSNVGKKNSCEFEGYGIGYGSTNQKWAGLFIDCLLESSYKDELEFQKEYWPESLYKLDTSLTKKAWFPEYTESPLERILQDFMDEVIKSGKTAEEALAIWEKKGKTLVAEANTPLEKVVKLPFKTLSYEFAKQEQVNAFLPSYREEGTVKVSLSTEEEGINGTALKVSCSYESEKTDQSLLITNSAAVSIVGWKDFIIEFDVKALETPEKDSYVWVQANDNDIHKYGWTKAAVYSKDEVVHVKAIIVNVLQNGRIPIEIGGYKMNDFVIDNFVITEKLQ